MKNNTETRLDQNAMQKGTDEEQVGPKEKTQITRLENQP